MGRYNTQTSGSTSQVSTSEFARYDAPSALQYNNTNKNASNQSQQNQQAAMNGDVFTVSGSVASMKFQSGAAIADEFLFTGLDTRTVGGTKAEYLAVSTKTGNVGNVTAGGTQAAWRTAFDEASTAVDNAIIQANTDRAVLGSQMNRLGFISTALMNQSTNTSASRSAIIDTDFAAETASLTKGQIMQQAATAMLAQANQMPNVILSLLK
jgi:flagellin